MSADSRGGLGLLLAAALLIVLSVDTTVPPKWRWPWLALLSVGWVALLIILSI